jgi:uroporphyrinogen-III synthase
VKALNLRLAARGRTGLPPELHVAAVGPATARACEGTGFPVELVAGEGHAAGLASSLRERMRPDARVLLVRPEGTHGLLAAELRAGGALVDEAPLYRTVPSEGAAVLAGRALAGEFAGVAFTAPSSLDCWIEAAGHAVKHSTTPCGRSCASPSARPPPRISTPAGSGPKPSPPLPTRTRSATPSPPRLPG